MSEFESGRPLRSLRYFWAGLIAADVEVVCDFGDIAEILVFVDKILCRLCMTNFQRHLSRRWDKW